MQPPRIAAIVRAGGEERVLPGIDARHMQPWRVILLHDTLPFQTLDVPCLSSFVSLRPLLLGTSDALSTLLAEQVQL